MDKNVIYYSQRCQYSQKILQAIKANDLDFKLISIDFSDEIPDYITVVPSIVKKNNLYTGKNAFDFIKNLIDDKKNKPQDIGIEPMGELGCIGCDPYSYIEGEQICRQDYYSFISGQPTRVGAYNSQESTNPPPSTSSASIDNLNKNTNVSKENLNEKQFDLNKLQELREKDSGIHIKRVNFQ